MYFFIDLQYNDNDRIPPYFNDLVNYLLNYVETRGLLRVSGRCDYVQILLDDILFKNKKIKDIQLKFSPHDIVGVLKGILRKLTEPIIPVSCFLSLINGIMSNNGSKEKNIITCHTILHELPIPSHYLLELLGKLWYNIHINSSVNGMDGI